MAEAETRCILGKHYCTCPARVSFRLFAQNQFLVLLILMIVDSISHKCASYRFPFHLFHMRWRSIGQFGQHRIKWQILPLGVHIET